MSAEAIGWVFRYSPYRGATLAVHLALADSVNDQNGNEFWMRQGRLAVKARVHRETVNRALARLVADGYLIELERRGLTRRYRFEFVATPVVYDSRSVTRDHTLCDERSHRSVTRDHTKNPRSNPRENLSSTGTLSIESVPFDASLAKPRRRDELFEAVAEVCDLDWQGGLTKAARGQLNAAVGQLREIEVMPDEVRRRASNWPRLFERATLTPSALVKHWPQLDWVRVRGSSDRFDWELGGNDGPRARSSDPIEVVARDLPGR